jgi:hypothetical protein
MLSKKRVHLQQFSIIHLPNSDLTYIRNPERNKIMCVPFYFLKTYIRNPSLFFISFLGNLSRAHSQTSHLYAAHFIYRICSQDTANLLFCPHHTWHNQRTTVTPVFPKKTKCKPICMPGSSSMHIVT